MGANQFLSANSNHKSCRQMGIGKPNGFTLLELLFAILIVATIASLSLPTIAKVVIDDEYGKATESVYEISRFAQLSSGMRGKAYGLFIRAYNADPLGNGIIVAAECKTSSCCTTQQFNAGETTTMRTLTLSDNYSSVRITAVLPDIFRTNGICFKPDGRVLNALNSQIVPSTIPEIGAGTVIIKLQQLTPMGAGNTVINPIEHRVEVGGNGDIFIGYGS